MGLFVFYILCFFFFTPPPAFPILHTLAQPIAYLVRLDASFKKNYVGLRHHCPPSPGVTQFLTSFDCPSLLNPVPTTYIERDPHLPLLGTFLFMTLNVWELRVLVQRTMILGH
jgi:hypothetical protein